MVCLDQRETKLSNNQWPTGVPWTRSQLLLAEKAALGFYVTDHPLRGYVDLLQTLKAIKSIDLSGLSSGVRISIGGIIGDLQPRTTKKGDRFALLRLEDEAGGTKCVLWPEILPASIRCWW